MGLDRNYVAEEVEKGKKAYNEIKNLKVEDLTKYKKTSRNPWGDYTYYDFGDAGAINGEDDEELQEELDKLKNDLKKKIEKRQNAIKSIDNRMATLKNNLEKYGIKDPGNEQSIETARRNLSNAVQNFDKQIADIKNMRSVYEEEARKAIEAARTAGQTVGVAVKENVYNVTEEWTDTAGNKHRSMYDFEEVRNREEAKRAEGMKKSFIILLPKKLRLRG
jgi:prefoldin subunit 5